MCQQTRNRTVAQTRCTFTDQIRTRLTEEICCSVSRWRPTLSTLLASDLCRQSVIFIQQPLLIRILRAKRVDRPKNNRLAKLLTRMVPRTKMLVEGKTQAPLSSHNRVARQITSQTRSKMQSSIPPIPATA